jgi:thiamine biosynthesis lipoprotein
MLTATASGIETDPASNPANQSTENALEGYEITFPAMGSTMSIIAYAPTEEKATKAFEDTEREVARLSNILTDYEPDSELNLFVANASTPTPLSTDLWNVLLASQIWHERSEGTFDASVGALTRLWRASRRSKSPPTLEAITNAKTQCGWRHIQLDSTKQSGCIDIQGVKIDLGGIAAGYIIDSAFDVMAKHGLTICLINAGGDIRCGDAPPGRTGWRIEVAPLAESPTTSDTKKSPVSDPQPLRRILLSNASIVTSGDLWQFYEFEGIRRSHIIDPKTGMGVPGPSVVAVIAKRCMDADAAATAISVMGIDRGMRFASQQHDLDAMIVVRDQQTNELQIRVTNRFPEGVLDPK